MDALLQLKGINKSFPGVKALSSAALNVYFGCVMAMVGDNGAGKSTLMKVLIGIIHQELNLILQFTIAENIFLGCEFVNRFGKIDCKKMFDDELLVKLNLRFKSDRMMGELSIGYQQMVEIAKVMSYESQIIIYGCAYRCVDRYRNRVAVLCDPLVESSGRAVSFISPSA